MYLLRRKSDGKYYVNPDYHSNLTIRFSGGNRSLWTENVHNCRPFKSHAGVKACREVRGAYPNHLRIDDKPAWQGPAWGKWWSKENAKVRREWERKRFEEKYEIVEIIGITTKGEAK